MPAVLVEHLRNSTQAGREPWTRTHPGSRRVDKRKGPRATWKSFCLALEAVFEQGNWWLGHQLKAGYTTAVVWPRCALRSSAKCDQPSISAKVKFMCVCACAWASNELKTLECGTSINCPGIATYAVRRKVKATCAGREAYRFCLQRGCHDHNYRPMI